MKQLLIAVFIVALESVLAPAGLLAQGTETGEDDSFLLRVNGTTSIPAGEIVDAAVIVNGDITVDGVIDNSLVVISGTAIVNGSVRGDITVVRGDLDLRASAQVDDVMLINSDLVLDPGATVAGDIEDRSGDFSLGRGFAVFSLLWWIGMLILGLVAGAVFAWLGRAQLFGAVETLRSEFVPSLITAILLWVVVPIAAVLVLFTIVGLPLGISTLIVLLPILLLLGLIVVGAWIGSYIIKSNTTGGAIGMTMIGVIILALVSLIPFVAVITGLAGMLGAGALVYRTFNRSRTLTPPNAPAPAA
ncbi:hypothetical protein BH23CHL4_BH23CHL4_02010 [soil metagenome]